MIIKRMTASFGKLENAELELKPGLNIVSMPNEGGKSTWCAFILSMLYGVDTSKKDTKEQLADKNKYQPWSGRPMEGIMDIDCAGKQIRLERKSKGAAVMKSFKATDILNGDELDMTAESVGAALTGVQREVYERSAFIKQAKLSVDQNPELEKRINSLVTAGDENISFADAEKKLKEWSRSLKFNKKGEIPELEQRLELVSAQLAQQSEETAKKDEIERKLKLVDEKLSFYEKQNELHEKHAILGKRKEVAQARMEVQKIEFELRKLTGGRKPVTRDQLWQLSNQYNKVRGMKQSAESVSIRSEKKPFVTGEKPTLPRAFEGLDADDILTKGARDEKRIEQFKKSGSRLFIAAAILLAAAIAAFLILKNVTALPYLPISAAPAAAAVVCAFAALMKRVDAKGRIEQIYRLYGGSDTFEIASSCASALCEYETECSKAVQEAESAKRIAEDAKQAEKELLETASQVLGGSGTFEEIPMAIESALKQAQYYDDIMKRYETAVSVRDSLIKTVGDDSGKYDLGSLPDPSITKEQVQQGLREYTQLRSELARSAALAEGSISKGKDPDVLIAQKQQIEKRLENANEEYEALQIALEELTKADGELRMRFSPVLNETAGEYLQLMTGGQYNALHLDKTFAASVDQSGESVSRDLRALSAGTEDLVYLAVRCAICKLLLSGREMPPMILDDALVNLDEGRMKKALALLLKIAKQRQVVLFTCHSREAECVECTEEINIIEMR